MTHGISTASNGKEDDASGRLSCFNYGDVKRLSAIAYLRHIGAEACVLALRTRMLASHGQNSDSLRCAGLV
jgi:hypothetical protein